MRFGVQLFGIRDLCKHQPGGLFQQLKDMGYRHIEPCVVFGEMGGFENVVWTPQDMDSFAPLAKAHGLTITSLHVFAADMLAALPDICALVQSHGIKDVVVPCPAFESKEQYGKAALVFKQVADALHKIGVHLLFHNSVEEITTPIDGQTAYEWLVAASGIHAGMQVDVGWLVYAGEDPEGFLWRNSDRVLSLHYKDVSGNINQSPMDQCGVCLGQGILSVTPCFQFARAKGIPQLVDQDQSPGDIMADLAASYQLLASITGIRENTQSELCILNIPTGEVTTVYYTDGVIEAPNWMKNGDLLVNRDGRIDRLNPTTGIVTTLDTGSCIDCNNDHVPSPDEQLLAISNNDEGGSRIYTVPLAGGAATKIVALPHSYLHGWSPDGKELAYCAFRQIDGETKVDIYTIPLTGGTEKRLTDGVGYNDGAEYAPDGETIWFNSTRSGLMQIWKINRDGSKLTQMTSNQANNWFAHVSPDGKQALYIAYEKDHLDESEHLPNMQVSLWLMNTDGSNQRKLLDFFGGQGSINVNSWSPDSRNAAFVKYHLGNTPKGGNA